MSTFLDALLLQAGYNAALVALGAALLGFAAGASGTFMFLRKRALVSDAMAHATLPASALLLSSWWQWEATVEISRACSSALR